MNSSTPHGRAQFDEDVLLARIFTGAEGWCLEVGAYDGTTGSPTLAFERRGWNAILIEPLPELAAKARASRKGPVICAAAGPAEGTVTLHHSLEDPAISSCASDNIYQSAMTRLRSVTLVPLEVPQVTIDGVLAGQRLTKLEFASIDVEGAEAAVLRGFDLERWRPRVVILEDNSRGADSSVRLIMASRGYRRFRTTGVNDWYARAEDRELVTLASRLGELRRRCWGPLRERAKHLIPATLKRALRRLGAGR